MSGLYIIQVRLDVIIGYMLISVVICTRNRADKIKKCLESILANKMAVMEIIVIDQSDNLKTKKIVRDFLDERIRYFKMWGSGVSRARNLGIKKCKGEIVAFTDDDCVTTDDWLEKIESSLAKISDIAGVFGGVLPYEPEKNNGKLCACLLEAKKEQIFREPVEHWRVGYSNNMAIRKKVFRKVGGFKTWLGPGSIGVASEDAEMVLKILFSKGKIYQNPDMVVYHDRWLTREELSKQQLVYAAGEAAVYWYYALKGKWLAIKIVGRFMGEIWLRFGEDVNSFGWLYVLKKPFCRLRGYGLATLMCLKGE